MNHYLADLAVLPKVLGAPQLVLRGTHSREPSYVNEVSLDHSVVVQLPAIDLGTRSGDGSDARAGSSVSYRLCLGQCLSLGLDYGLRLC